jgi:hypothetical protein
MPARTPKADVTFLPIVNYPIDWTICGCLT